MLKNNKTTYTNSYRIPLQNILAEQIIIGYLLCSISLKKRLARSINIHFFSLKQYQILYSHIIKVETGNKSIHIIQIINYLWGKKILREVGGINNIITSIQKSQNLYLSYSEYTNIKYLINTLHYYYLKRLFIQYNKNIIQINYLYNLSIDKIYQKSIKHLNYISDIYTIYRPNHIEQDVSYFLYTINQKSKYDLNILSGFKDLDKITKGFKHGDLVIIAGRPSMGKTSFALNIVHNLSIKLRVNVHMFSLEMSKHEILNKLISLISNIDSQTVESRLITSKDWLTVQQACKILTKSPLSIDDNAEASIDYIKSRCHDCNIKKSVIIIDYLQLISIENKNIENRTQEIGNVTRELKLLSKRIKSVTIILSQLNRNIENRANKRPLLSDLRESGCIDYSNLPIMKKHKQNVSIETLNCLKKYYFIQRIKKIIFYQNSVQYIFGTINFTHKLLCTTHNHNVYTYNHWNKKDQIKYQQFHTIAHSSTLNSQITTELAKLFLIKRLNKNKVYDIKLSQYHNFTVGNYIIHNSIEQDADLILMLYKNSENIDRRIIDIVIAKHRHGPTGDFQLLFHANVCKFDNMENFNLPQELQI